jgi:hypothetical protein
MPIFLTDWMQSGLIGVLGDYFKLRKFLGMKMIFFDQIEVI